MDKIGIKEVRLILLEILSEYSGICECIVSTPDEKFLKINLRDEFGMEPSEFENMFGELENFCGVIIDWHNLPDDCSFNKEPSVKNFIETVNYFAN